MSENFDFESLDEQGWAKLEEAHSKVNAQVADRQQKKIEKARAEVIEELERLRPLYFERGAEGMEAAKKRKRLLSLLDRLDKLGG